MITQNVILSNTRLISGRNFNLELALLGLSGTGFREPNPPFIFGFKRTRFPAKRAFKIYLKRVDCKPVVLKIQSVL